MKTKRWSIFFYIGLFIAIGIGSQAGMPKENSPTEPFVTLLFIVVAILLVGYGLRLKMLLKKGIENTKSS